MEAKVTTSELQDRRSKLIQDREALKAERIEAMLAGQEFTKATTLAKLDSQIAVLEEVIEVSKDRDAEAAKRRDAEAAAAALQERKDRLSGAVGVYADAMGEAEKAADALVAAFRKGLDAVKEVANLPYEFGADQGAFSVPTIERRIGQRLSRKLGRINGTHSNLFTTLAGANSAIEGENWEAEERREMEAGAVAVFRQRELDIRSGKISA